jgi:predicted regulator of Ras-like GTPase activity (Roadblock/LC7/MglB family)
MVQIRWKGFGGDVAQLEAQLEALRDRTESRCVLLLDSAGRLLTLAGDAPQFDLTTFVSLMAADFCATRELARLLGEPAFHTVFHQGEALSLYMTQATEGTILATVFDSQTTLGLVRYAVRRALPPLITLISGGYDHGNLDEQLQDGFQGEALERFDQLFGGG